MKLDPQSYAQMVRRAAPPSALGQNLARAFVIGGGICLLGEALRTLYARHFAPDMAGTLTSVTLIALSAAATVPGWYQKLAVRAGAGTLVPITGFANSVVSAAIEFKAEGWVSGVGAHIFQIAGPVLAYGTLASWVWGLLYWALGRTGERRVRPPQGYPAFCGPAAHLRLGGRGRQKGGRRPAGSGV